MASRAVLFLRVALWAVNVIRAGGVPATPANTAQSAIVKDCMTQTVAVLFVDPEGPYPEMRNVDCWDESRDARLYLGPHPVVAHPPCNLWVNMAAVNWKRYGRQRPAWYLGGDDGNCFQRALASVRAYGGVLEHPAESHAWGAYGLVTPESGRLSWTPRTLGFVREWVCEVWQSAYGNLARKRTWLVYCGKLPPFELRWERNPGTHQVGWFDRNKPTLSKKMASRTPPAFAKELVRLARHAVR
jgi:hypothetical protein